MVPPSSAQLPVPAIVEANNGAGIKQTDQRRPPVELLDIDPAILNWLEGMSVLHQTTGGLVRVGKRTIGSELHAATIAAIVS